jgi:hypothetical protein
METEREYDFMRDYAELQRLQADPELVQHVVQPAFSRREKAALIALWSSVMGTFAAVAVFF